MFGKPLVSLHHSTTKALKPQIGCDSNGALFVWQMAIKWMALECIHYRKFTHQSDVWSYGKSKRKVSHQYTELGNISGTLCIFEWFQLFLVINTFF